MAQLEEVMRMINLKTASKNAPAVQNEDLQRLLETVNGGYIRPQEVLQSLVDLARAVADIQVGVDAAVSQMEATHARNERIIKGLEPALGGIHQSLGKKPETFDPVISSVLEVKGDIERLIKAINSIKLPEV